MNQHRKTIMSRTTKHWLQRLLYFLAFLFLGPAIGVCGALMLAAAANYSGLHHLPSVALPAVLLLVLVLPVACAWSAYLKSHPKPRLLARHTRRPIQPTA
jgi:hypothetical protein